VKLRKLRQPWLFIYSAVGFVPLDYYLTGGDSLVWSIVGGLVFAVLLSTPAAIRRSRMAKANW
jgi:hypothetical protein